MMKMFSPCNFSAEKKEILINNMKIYKNGDDKINKIIMVIWQINHTRSIYFLSRIHAYIFHFFNIGIVCSFSSQQ